MSARNRNVRLTAGVLTGVVGLMLGVAFYSPTIYRLFCEATGYAGTPKTENVARSQHTGAALVTVRFDANVNSALPWRFRPAQRSVHVKMGDETLVHYTAVNHSDQPVTGTATFNVIPEKAAPYFSKIECFCFTEQTLAPGQEVSMPVLFYIDPALADDVNARDATTITLSYTFHRAEGGTAQQGSAPRIAVAPTAGTGG
jgi:cytochrome c oxidase assembly protein subunit 11